MDPTRPEFRESATRAGRIEPPLALAAANAHPELGDDGQASIDRTPPWGRFTSPGPDRGGRVIALPHPEGACQDRARVVPGMLPGVSSASHPSALVHMYEGRGSDALSAATRQQSKHSLLPAWPMPAGGGTGVSSDPLPPWPVSAPQRQCREQRPCQTVPPAVGSLDLHDVAVVPSDVEWSYGSGGLESLPSSRRPRLSCRPELIHIHRIEGRSTWVSGTSSGC
jgi:hypothetical protein